MQTGISRWGYCLSLPVIEANFTRRAKAFRRLDR
jgi:hypothetical protein